MLISEIPELPLEFVQALNKKGYETLYPPQEDAVGTGVLDGKNLVLATPTASGKTLVAMMAAMRAIERGGKVVYLAPLRALASEKYEEFKEIFESMKRTGSRSKFRVFISTGDYDSSGESLGGGDVIILTNERFDSILRHNASWIDSVSLFIADEVHLVGDSHRGPTLEMILAKAMKFVSSAQILALSATISNSKDLAEWLHAELVDTNWRPVKLLTGIYDYGTLSFVEGGQRRLLQSNRGAAIDVAIDSVKDGGQSLIFCDTRKRAVSAAEKAAEILPKHLSFEESAGLRAIAHKITSEGEETDLSKRLAAVVERGVAFHHAGLDSKHRKIIEDAYKNREIKILSSTPTLAAGVNLPARRVVLSSLFRYNYEEGGQTPISVMEFRQMAGRAGRPRYDKVGEIVLLSGNQMSSEEIYEHYIEAKPEPIRSKLASDGPLRMHLLGLVASSQGLTEEEIHGFFKITLFGSQYNETTVKSSVKKALVYLEEEGLIVRRARRFRATDFGRRVALLYIDPESAIVMRRGIKQSEKAGTHVLGMLHLLTQTPDMAPKFGIRTKDQAELEEVVQGRRSEMLIPLPAADSFEYYRDFDSVLGDFRTVLALTHWINENPEQSILEKYSIEPGDLHRMVDNADWLLYSFGELSQLFGRHDLVVEASDLRERIINGIKSELIPLTKLEGIGRVRARSLFEAGFTSLEKLMDAPVERISRVSKIGPAIANQIKKQLP